MNFTNLSNTFSVFGNFAVFDEDTISIINKIYSNCDIAINNEPVNQMNRSGRYMQIVDKQKHITIFLRPNRLDVQLAGCPKENKVALFREVIDIYKAFSQMFENSFATRIAFVSNHFVFDDDEENMKKLGKIINPLKGDICEVTLRTNSIEQLMNEDINVVFNLNNIRIGASNNPDERRKALMVTLDINTVAINNNERFDLHELEPYFSAFYELSYDKLSELQYI